MSKQFRKVCSNIIVAFAVAIFSLHVSRAIAQVSIGCPGTSYDQGGNSSMVAGPKNSMEFSLQPGSCVTIYNQHWLFVDANGQQHAVPSLYSSSAWGTFTVTGGGNTLGWSAPVTGGTYTVQVSANRKCNCSKGIGHSGGAYAEDTIVVQWGVTVSCPTSCPPGSCAACANATLHDVPGYPDCDHVVTPSQAAHSYYTCVTCLGGACQYTYVNQFWQNCVCTITCPNPFADQGAGDTVQVEPRQKKWVVVSTGLCP